MGIQNGNTEIKSVQQLNLLDNTIAAHGQDSRDSATLRYELTG